MASVNRSLQQGNVALVRAAIVKPVVMAFKEEGNDISHILEEHGLSEAQLHDPATFVRHDTVYAIYQEIALATRPDFCATVGQALAWEQFFPLADALKGAVTLGDLITRFTSAVSKESNAVDQSFLVEGDYAYYRVKRRFRPKISPSQTDAFQVAIWISLLHRVLDFRWDPVQIILRLPAPAALPDEFHGVRAIKCDDQGFSIRFPSKWLNCQLKPSSFDPKPGFESDPGLSAPVDLLTAVENVLRPRLADRNMNVAVAARMCGFRVDTLNRRLAKDGVTISGVLAKLRRLEAERLLADNDTKIGEIAEYLGYSDATAFTRAFKKWTGKSPTAYRRS